MSVMTLPCAAEISGEILLSFKSSDHSYKHLLCASVEGTFWNFLYLFLNSQMLKQPGSVALMFGTFLFMLLPPNGFQPAHESTCSSIGDSRG